MGFARRPATSVAAAVAAVTAALAGQAALAAPAGAAPVPVPVSRPATAVTYVTSAHPDRSYFDTHGGTLRVGPLFESGRNVHRSFVQVPTDGLEGRIVTRARLRVTQTWSFTCQAKPVEIYQTGAVSPTTTWSTQPAALRRIATATPPGTNTGCAADQVFRVDVTSAVRAAAEASLPDVTFGFRAANESDAQQWRRLDASVVLEVETVVAPAEPTVEPTA